MEIVVAYDVSTITAAGRRRLRRVAAACLAYGQRVQKSVFECVLTPSQLVQLEHRLVQLIDPSEDRLRIYQLREPRERFTRSTSSCDSRSTCRGWRTICSTSRALRAASLNSTVAPSTFGRLSPTRWKPARELGT